MSMQWRDGNRIRLLENGEAFFPRVHGAIRRAQHYLLLETFILFEDQVGKDLHAELLAAARRGVKIEMMVDGYGSPDLSDEYVHSLTAEGVRFIYYDPRPLVFGMRTNVFRRLHRKIVVADGEIAFVGGINFSEEHISSYGPQAKQDYAVEVKGPIVEDIARYVQQQIGSEQVTRRWWGHRSHRPAHNSTPGDAQALFVFRDNDQHRDDIEQHYMDMLRKAQQEVIIANAYFFPGYRLLREMREAAKRGVRVKLIVQGEPDMPIVKVGAELLYNYLLDAGVEIYEYIRRPLHGKIAVQDQQWSTVGSSNLDPLSLSLNLEANLVIHDRQFNQLLRDNLEGLIARDCQRVDGSKLPKRSWWQLSKSVLVFHFLRHFPAIAGWLPAHTPKLALVEPPVQPEMETQDRVETDNPGAKS
ncbi:cardiolipin synthase ClsB [Erwiniaceae bacterium BAC15a-03b]|uniref:Cardiolipin synthase B n=1 Tax=Winslowiella arboricola TaxID=2978220 RepID=A0A9J6PQU3_9GAMM|nr:cardiolipin synthase ClsB [Winslowiella arboricola]MCU5772883.1 cardiolipin synthase ClsB [Winslowiella arboricola]MCU5780689.1 cardiolipin synthase ClsB [Winslowiella arboricola]